jgi:hypothetical protein
MLLKVHVDSYDLIARGFDLVSWKGRRGGFVEGDAWGSGWESGWESIGEVGVHENIR